MSELEELKAVAESLHSEYLAEAMKLDPLRDRWLAAKEAHENALRAAGQVYVLHYWRHHYPRTEEFLTLDEAVRYAENGEDLGEMAAEKITGPGGFVRELR